VVYDRAAGLVGGAGTVTVPKGAFPADPNRSGSGGFALAAGYSRTGTRPDGLLAYTVTGSRFVVATTTFDWLVVSGDTARTSGPVTVNGRSGYRADVTVTDRGRNDTFRVVVTDAAGQVVHDSGVRPVAGSVTIGR
jgi:hypothetical protein